VTICWQQPTNLLKKTVCVRTPVPSQVQGRKEETLIDTSISITKDDANSSLFEENYTPRRSSWHRNHRIRVSRLRRWQVIRSAASVRSSMAGRRELAARSTTISPATKATRDQFRAKSVDLAPTASGTGIFGGLWHVRTLFEFGSSGSANAQTKTIWVFSDAELARNGAGTNARTGEGEWSCFAIASLSNMRLTVH